MALLAYFFSVSLRQQLKRVAERLTPRAVLEKMATLQMSDVRTPTTDGTELPLIRRTEPNKDAALILIHLGLDLPPQPTRRPKPQTDTYVVATFGVPDSTSGPNIKNLSAEIAQLRKSG